MPLIGPRRVLLFGGGNKYLVWDRFDADLAAGAVNGTLATPGGSKGSVLQNTRAVNDTAGNKLSISSGEIVTSGITGGGDPRLRYGPFTRADGLLAKWGFRWVTSRSGGGWHSNAALTTVPEIGLAAPSAQLGHSPPNATSFGAFSSGVDYTVWAALFTGTGGAIWAQGGAFTDPTLFWVDDLISSAASMYFYPVCAVATDCQIQVDDVQIIAGSPYTTEASIASVYMDNPPNGVNYATQADAIHYLNFTLPGSPSAGDKIELRYRYQDATNYWTAYILRNAGNTAWSFLLDKVTAGTPANQITVADAGTPRRMWVSSVGNVHKCGTEAGSTWTRRGGDITDAAFNTATEIGPWYAVGAVSKLSSYKRTWTSVS